MAVFRWLATGCAVLACCLGLVACGGNGSAGPAMTGGAPATTSSAATTVSPPSWVDIPSIAARSSLIQLGLNADRSVQVPPVTQPQQAGWYKFGPPPGGVGPAVILGHIDGDHQQGIFWRLHEVKPGDKVMVGQQDGHTLTFTVTKVDSVAKDSFPTDAVYGNTPDPELRLITCGGAFDASTGHYLDNLIVYANLAS
jgi:LPXTG-site transpeptidase (sortase) family protein